MTAKTFVFDPVLSDADADAVLHLAETFGDYGLYSVEKSETPFAPELPQRWDAVRNHIRTGGFGRETGRPRDLALRTSYLRETYAYGDEIHADAIVPFRSHEGFFAAARELFGRSVIEPAIVYANMILPGQELGMHTDVPEFRGANRKLFPQWLMVVMHHSGLFDAWRMPIATGISYFGNTSGGELVYYPDGAGGAACRLATRHNTAILLDTDSVFHGVDRVGGADVPAPDVHDGDRLRFGDDARWHLVRGVADRPGTDEVIADYDWDDVRYSISWKAYCFADRAERDAWRTHADDLTLGAIFGRLCNDLVTRGVLERPDALPSDREFADLLIDVYERFPEPADA